MSQKIGIIGGSFDPIHNGHLIIALDACEQFSLDRVLFVPAFQAPLKSKSPDASPAQRMQMVEKATEEEPRFLASDADYRFESTSYSVRTAATLKQDFPDADLHWILGADQIAQLHLWRDIEKLSEQVTFIAFERPGFKSTASPELPSHTRIKRGKLRQLDISSTEIRERLKSGQSAKYFLPANVFAYIKAENLYL
ncbi:nicotinate-nucleotide adenylyltransferase [Pelagicoccus mobilis]|uniref:Probable nicotinate-nucleotide adenylyltransferase n=1 Tax=Pelagicoccus mobilis TaxID=415221 RepID=A0A934VRD7_9BACT|nr:nicotinate-nucleotide adenylyltransferase [Pelagicoccus mobilis]MBK1877835.1 nicotinate (nicotinamide) nucleotide adenylyltransferase [Pelagicoccus mobilis]